MRPPTTTRPELALRTPPFDPSIPHTNTFLTNSSPLWPGAVESLLAAPDDDVVRCQCVCHIHLGNYEQAIQLAKGASTLAFEHAYCCYRTNQARESPPPRAGLVSMADAS